MMYNPKERTDGLDLGIQQAVKEAWNTNVKLIYDRGYNDGKYDALYVRARSGAKYGEWKGNFCSNCGVSRFNFISFNFSDDDKEAFVKPFGKWNFCPRCGADMQKYEEEVSDEQSGKDTYEA